jgi:hypothetical protein
MKAVGRILRSYFHRRFILVLMISAGYLFIIANTLLFFNKTKIAWCFFLYTLAVLAAATGFHLRQALESSESDLLPNYRRSQLTAAGIILSIFSLWPMLLIILWGGPLSNSLAFYLFFICLALWVAFFSAGGTGWTAVLGLAAIIWAFRDLYKLVNASPEASRIARLGIYFGASWPVYAVLASLLGLLLFVFYFKRVSNTSLTNEWTSDYLQCLKTQDWMDNPLTLKLTEKTISRLSTIESGQKPSLYSLIRLFQFGLFSPMNTTSAYYGFLGGFIYCSLLTFFGLYIAMKESMNFYLPFAYYWIAAMLAGDFLSHRNRIPAIYIQSRLPSRRSFVFVTILSYLLIVGKAMLSITASMIVLNIFFPFAAWAEFIRLCAMGIVSAFIQVFLSLSAGSKVKSAIAWMIGSLFPTLFLALLIPLYTRHWYFIAGAAFFSGLLVWPAIRKWENLEFDFVVH